jgi:hypothetical protein
MSGDGAFRVGDTADADGKLVVYHKGMNRSALGVYNGEFVNGQREGQGTFSYANGDSYIGVSCQLNGSPRLCCDS